MTDLPKFPKILIGDLTDCTLLLLEIEKVRKEFAAKLACHNCNSRDALYHQCFLKCQQKMLPRDVLEAFK